MRARLSVLSDYLRALILAPLVHPRLSGDFPCFSFYVINNSLYRVNTATGEAWKTSPLNTNVWEKVSTGREVLANA